MIGRQETRGDSNIVFIFHVNDWAAGMQAGFFYFEDPQGFQICFRSLIMIYASPVLNVGTSIMDSKSGCGGPVMSSDIGRDSTEYLLCDFCLPTCGRAAQPRLIAIKYSRKVQ